MYVDGTWERSRMLKNLIQDSPLVVLTLLTTVCHFEFNFNFWIIYELFGIFTKLGTSSVRIKNYAFCEYLFRRLRKWMVFFCDFIKTRRITEEESFDIHLYCIIIIINLWSTFINAKITFWMFLFIILTNWEKSF